MSSNTAAMSEAKQNFKEVKIPVPWGHLSGKWWGPRGKQPILAIHGWQDNAGTFDPLAALLPEDISLLAIEMPGHGHSSHYPPGLSYYLYWDGILIVRRIVKYFKWNKISILGHSMGGGIGFMYAATFPNDVEKLISLDVGSPAIKDTDAIAAFTGPIVDKFLHYETLTEDAVPCNSGPEMIDLIFEAQHGSVTRQGAQILSKRAMVKAPSVPGKHEDLYLFTRDVRLKVAGLGLLTIDQVMAFAKRITCQYMNIKSVPGLRFEHPEYYTDVLDAISKSASRYEYHEVIGAHHVHLNAPEKVLPILVKFLTTDKTEEPLNGTAPKVLPDPSVEGSQEPNFPAWKPSSSSKKNPSSPEPSTPTKEPSTANISNGSSADK